MSELQSDFVVQSPQDFYRDLLTHISSAKKRIWLQSMNVDPGKYVDEAIKKMGLKARAGIDVRMTVDWISEQYYQSRFDYLPNINVKWQLEKRAFRKQRKALLDQLHQAGAQVVYTNIPSPFLSITPQLGRNHTKIYLVDDTVWMGGINFMPSSFESYDGMIKSDHPKLVKALAQHYSEVNDLRPQTSYSVKIDSTTRLLVDNGQRGRSLIYDEAISQTLAAQKEILFISQLVPSGRFLTALIKKAEQGIPVTFVTSSHADEMYSTFFPKLLYRQFLNKIKHLPHFKIFHVDKKVHLKLLVLDGQDIFFGSHNLSELGVQFGTEEIMLHSQSQKVVTRFTALLKALKIFPASQPLP